MRKYKIELHCHTSESSPCGHVSACDLVELYIKKEYDAIVITDHFAQSVFSIEDNIENKFLEGYMNALLCARDRIKVYLGVELRVNENLNDYLIYGEISNLLKMGKELFNMPLEKVYEVVKANNLVIFQAHPNRNHMIQMSTQYLDGIEVYNMHTEHDSRNHISVKFAMDNNIKGISGSDAHRNHHVGRGGIFTDILPDNEIDLKDILESGDFSLIF